MRDLVEVVYAPPEHGIAALALFPGRNIDDHRAAGCRLRASVLYVLDEPTTGLHATDTDKLMVLLDRLVDDGNSVIVIEHDMSVVARCDWVIDLGPEGGKQGGRLVATAPPKTLEAQESGTPPATSP